MESLADVMVGKRLDKISGLDKSARKRSEAARAAFGLGRANLRDYNLNDSERLW